MSKSLATGCHHRMLATNRLVRFCSKWIVRFGWCHSGVEGGSPERSNDTAAVAADLRGSLMLERFDCCLGAVLGELARSMQEGEAGVGSSQHRDPRLDVVTAMAIGGDL